MVLAVEVTVSCHSAIGMIVPGETALSNMRDEDSVKN
jgi:hypothetical protein